MIKIHNSSSHSNESRLFRFEGKSLPLESFNYYLDKENKSINYWLFYYLTSFIYCDERIKKTIELELNLDLSIAAVKISFFYSLPLIL